MPLKQWEPLYILVLASPLTDRQDHAEGQRRQPPHRPRNHLRCVVAGAGQRHGHWHERVGRQAAPKGPQKWTPRQPLLQMQQPQQCRGGLHDRLEVQPRDRAASGCVEVASFTITISLRSMGAIGLKSTPPVPMAQGINDGKVEGSPVGAWHARSIRQAG